VPLAQAKKSPTTKTKKAAGATTAAFSFLPKQISSSLEIISFVFLSRLHRRMDARTERSSAVTSLEGVRREKQN
jgi:hypothetical protein